MKKQKPSKRTFLGKIELYCDNKLNNVFIIHFVLLPLFNVPRCFYEFFFVVFICIFIWPEGAILAYLIKISFGGFFFGCLFGMFGLIELFEGFKCFFGIIGGVGVLCNEVIT